ncbi:hypothetical protein [Fulvimonas soli]|jgi:hypothetical protein|uniref:Uncharacterized protein n=1 Tax=Fulvimonas soli TaxID=155197 RepID=A0A316II24_9GAMM|nr:hypothetical protein [Fulvimonas soli]PWK92520.1 hypothetical protein C7456_102255 [Fulvimonas soli]TNY27732.1 hypothetical protein BV497_01570 [Fulvimonas soli]
MPVLIRELPRWLALAACGWLLLGLFLLLLTPLPAHTARLGWSPLFWLALAPLSVLAGTMLRGGFARVAREI